MIIPDKSFRIFNKKENRFLKWLKKLKFLTWKNNDQYNL